MTNHLFRFGIVAAQARSGDDWIAKARHAEALGYATMLIPDTLGQTLSPLPALAVAAAATKSLRVGSYVLANDFRNPLLIARECATLDFLSGGRFELGIGVGRPGVEDDNRMLGIPFDSGGVRIERLSEALGIVKALWGGQPAPTPGRHYTIAAATVFPQPIQQPRPPILIAGAGKRLLSLAAREADIVALAGQPQEGEAALAERIGWLRAAAGARFDQLELNLNLMAVGKEMPPWLARMGIDVQQLIEVGSPAVLMGSLDEMCDQLLARREALGISYITISDALMDAFAPVVERLAGR